MMVVGTDTRPFGALDEVPGAGSELGPPRFGWGRSDEPLGEQLFVLLGVFPEALGGERHRHGRLCEACRSQWCRFPPCLEGLVRNAVQAGAAGRGSDQGQDRTACGWVCSGLPSLAVIRIIGIAPRWA